MKGCTDAPSNGNGGASKPPTNGSDNGNGSGNGNGSTRLTDRQLAAIYAIAKAKGMDKDDVQRMSVQGYDRVPDFLNKSQASDMIQSLQSA